LGDLVHGDELRRMGLGDKEEKRGQRHALTSARALCAFENAGEDRKSLSESFNVLVFFFFLAAGRISKAETGPWNWNSNRGPFGRDL
jgi:hypothetical protein